MREYTVELVLTGTHTGATINIRGMQFVKGVGKFSGTKEAVDGRVLYMGRCYGAFPKGSDELATAQRFWKEHQNGLRGAIRSEADVGDSNSVQTASAVVGGPGVSGSAEVPAGDGAGDAGASGGDSGLGANGDGQADAGVLPGEEPTAAQQHSADTLKTISDAVMALSPQNDEHWSAEGEPSIMALVEITGIHSITRAMVQRAAGKWTREDAQSVAV